MDDEGGSEKFFVKKISSCFKSHIGVLFLLVCYSASGAKLFEFLEQDHEVDLLLQIAQLRNSTVLLLWQQAHNNSMDMAQWQRMAERKFVEYETFSREHLQNLQRSSVDAPAWTLWTALLYCGTIYTTIGYGYLAPKTMYGRVATIIYAAIGIPLCLLSVAQIGQVFTSFLSYLSWNRWKLQSWCRLVRTRISSRRNWFSNVAQSSADTAQGQDGGGGGGGGGGCINAISSPSSRRHAAAQFASRFHKKQRKRSDHWPTPTPAVTVEQTDDVTRTAGYREELRYHQLAMEEETKAAMTSSSPKTQQQVEVSSTEAASGSLTLQQRRQDSLNEGSVISINVNADESAENRQCNRSVEADSASNCVSPPHDSNNATEGASSLIAGHEEATAVVEEPLRKTSSQSQLLEVPAAESSHPKRRVSFDNGASSAETSGQESERDERTPSVSSLGSFQFSQTSQLTDKHQPSVLAASVILLLYILLGALMYQQWEDWTFFEAFYFIFVSLTTVGFGDVAPRHPKFFIFASLYVFLGLGFLSMLINTVIVNVQIKLENARIMARIKRTGKTLHRRGSVLLRRNSARKASAASQQQ